MKDQKSTRLKNIGRMLVVYLGGAWVFIEAFNFLIDKYGWDTAVLDVIILTIIFGLPAISLCQAFGLNVLCGILFKGSTSSKSK